MRRSLYPSLEAWLRLTQIRGYRVFWLIESISGLLVLIAAYTLVVRALGVAKGVEIPVFFRWSRSAVPDATAYGIDPFRSGGHGTLRLADAPTGLATMDALLLLMVAVAVFMALRQIRGLFEDVGNRGQLAEHLAYRLRRMGWFSIAAGGAWMLRDTAMSWWASDNLRDPDLLDSVIFTTSTSPLVYVGFGAGFLLVVVSGFMRHVMTDDLYGDLPADRPEVS